MTLTLSSTINFPLSFVFFKGTTSPSFTDVFYKNRHHQTKQAMKNQQAQVCSIFIKGYCIVSNFKDQGLKIPQLLKAFCLGIKIYAHA